MDVNQQDLMKLVGVGGVGLMGGARVLGEEPTVCDGLSGSLEREYALSSQDC